MPRPVVVNQLGPEIGAVLAAHALQPHVLTPGPGQAPWEVEDADVLLTGPNPAWFNAPKSAPGPWPGRLRWVQVASAGVDWFPNWLFDGPAVTCGRGHAAVPIAEYVLTAMLLLEKRLDRVRARDAIEWVRHTLGTLDGRTLGLAGYGAIGQAVAARAAAFGMHIVALRAGPWGEGEAPDVARATDLAELFARSDHLVLALPLTRATAHCVNAEVLAQSKPGLHLINVARGGLVDQPALLSALDAGRVGYATLDVTDPEPLPAFHEIYTHPRIRLTPHVSWSGAATRTRLASQIAANLSAYVAGGELAGLVDAARGY